MKKLFGKIMLILAGIGILTAAMPQMTFAADTKAPVVKSLTIDTKHAEPQDTVTVTLHIEDESELDMDMAESYLYFQNEGQLSRPFLFEKISDNKYQAEQVISETWLNGKYSVSELVLTDVAGNEYRKASSDLFPDVYFEVSGASSDRTAPEIVSISIDRNEVQVSDVIGLSLTVSDESSISLSRLDSYMLFRNGSFHSRQILFTAAGDGTIQAQIPIDESYVDGTYSLELIRLTDIIGNTFLTRDASVYPQLQFHVSGNPATNVYKKPGWYLADGKWYYNNADGQFVTGWNKINDRWYYMDPAGVMLTGWQYINGKWYYMDPSSGAMKTGWLASGGNWYYLADSGAMQTGWLLYKNKKYYLDLESGAMKTGWCEIDGARYFFDPSGAQHIGWLFSDGCWYFFDDSGEMHVGWLLYREHWYYLNWESGVMVTGWCELDGVMYYFNPDGTKHAGWLNADGYRYYFDEYGALKHGWLYTDGLWYYLDDETGRLRTGWLNIGEVWYFMNEESGAMQTGWLSRNGYWYYLKGNGVMAQNEWFGGYWFGGSGAWIYQPLGSWKKNKMGWWFGDTSGWYAKDTTLKINGSMYQFNTAGYLVE